MSRTILVDVCGTLYAENTTAGFVRFAARAGILRRTRRFWLLEQLRREPARKLVIILGWIMGRDLFRLGYISCLAGATRIDLQVQAVEYVKALEARKTIAAVHDRLAQFVVDGWQPILVSNSLDVVVAAIADRKGYNWLASSLGWCGDVCTGDLTVDLKGRKLKAFEEAFGPCPAERLAVMTDNRSDSDLIDAASLAVLIAQGQQKPWMKQYVSEQINY